MQKIGSFVRRYKLHIVILIIGIFLSLFISQKEGYHMDEVLSYELSNAEFTPWIVPTQPEGRLEKFVQNEVRGENFGETISNIVMLTKDALANRGNSVIANYKADIYDLPVWITNEQFANYMTVKGEDSFNALSVYYNVTDDNHPPIHFMMINLISSIFQGQFGVWIGCIINLIAMAVTLYFLAKICRECFEEEQLSIPIMMLYGFSFAAISTTLLIRMYGMLTMWCVISLYLHLKKWKDKGFHHNKVLILVTVLGFLTQYFFVFYAAFLALITVIRLVIERKRRKESAHYILSMMIAAFCGIGIYPFSIDDLLHSGRGVEVLENLGSGFSDYFGRLGVFANIIVEEVFGGYLSTAIIFLVVMICISMVIGKRKPNTYSKEIPHYWIWIPVAGYLLIVSKVAPYLLDRYIMPILPMISLGVLLTASHFLKQVITDNKMQNAILYLLVGIMILPNLITGEPNYLYKGYTEQLTLSKEYSDDSCVCVYDGVSYYENVPEFTNYKQTLLVKEEELEAEIDAGALQDENELIVILKENIGYDGVNESLQQAGYEMTEILFEESVHGDLIFRYQK